VVLISTQRSDAIVFDIDTFEFKYLKCNPHYYNDDAPVEAQRTIDKRAMSLEVQVFSSVVVVVSVMVKSIAERLPRNLFGFICISSRQRIVDHRRYSI
jgi:hypothetical protein